MNDKLYGYRNGNNGIEIGIAYMDGYSKPCLAYSDGKYMRKLATFKNERAAVDFLDAFAYFVGGTPFKWLYDDDLPVGLRTAAGWKWDEIGDDRHDAKGN